MGATEWGAGTQRNPHPGVPGAQGLPKTECGSGSNGSQSHVVREGRLSSQLNGRCYEQFRRSAPGHFPWGEKTPGPVLKEYRSLRPLPLTPLHD